MKTLVCAAIAALLAAPGLHAWNYAGHLAVAYIAYERLTPAVRARVDAIIRKHPDYARWIKDVPPQRRGLEAFMQAAYWPDAIRGDPRFWEPGS
ncbi:MAG TPA: S1/P1 nuclease, partial [Bryobacteraceae bacterium]|nr:S1/P1 nuclease [Bryobacteraceae bacterium]